ncbi:MAG TPA: molybdopterin cofactor-binding domain-containing protein, partial [Anaerolineales bacterium]|nr:molybdopterin cofactor-binding domain-containing protein [Anaerolineales bacterium]
MAEIHGLGSSMKRKEDARFIQGRGNFIDDHKLPGMLWLDIVRSPYAHAKIKNIDTSKAAKIPGVLGFITGKDLEKYNLHWMPTLAGDKQMVLPVDTVKYQSQEVVGVIATDRYTAADGVAAVEVEYDPLPVVIDPKKALEPGATKVRDDKESNRIWHWEVGDQDGTAAVFANAATVVKEKIYIPRIHVASMETCGCLADWDGVNKKLTFYVTSQAPHIYRTVLALVAGHVGLSEENIRVVSPDLGGGFGGKVPVYPGYVIAVAASVLLGHPVKWIEDRSENLSADSFARDYHINAELAADKDGHIIGMRMDTVADHGYSDAQAAPSKFPAGLFHIATGSYDFQKAFMKVDGVYTNKPPGGVAYRCSFRVTEAVHAIERMVDIMAHERGEDPAEFRMKNFIKAEQFPYMSALGWEYDSGDYHKALKLAMDMVGYADLRKEQAEKRARGELMGIGISSFTEIVGAGPAHQFDIIGLKMFDSCEIRVHPTGKAIARFGTKSQGQGHETTFAMIVAETLGIPFERVILRQGDEDHPLFGNHTGGSRSTVGAGSACHLAA